MAKPENNEHPNIIYSKQYRKLETVLHKPNLKLEMVSVICNYLINANIVEIYELDYHIRVVMTNRNITGS